MTPTRRAPAYLAVALSALLVGLLAPLTTPAPAAAAVAPGAIVISEIMYNPVSDDGDHEYVELFNPTSEPVSLAGLIWGQGIEGALPAVSIPAGGFVVVSPDVGATEATYGITPIAVYDGGLRNRGERLALVDPGQEVDGLPLVVAEVDYGDDAPWPIPADGDGPSIERIDPSLPSAPDDAGAWQASPDGGTPGRPPAAAAPGVSDIEVGPAEPGVPVTVSASVGGAGAELFYRIGFGSERRLVMAPDGARHRAAIPGAEAGAVVRFRIQIPDGPAHPPADDSRRYEGYVVASPGLDTDLPRFQWFIDDDDYDEMLGGSRFDRERLFPAVLAYDGRVYDGVQVQVRGGDYGRERYPKQSFNVEMPDGYVFDAPELFDYPVDEFALQAEYVDRTKGRAHASWYVFDSEGFPRVPSHFVQLDRNGRFYGLYRLSEKLDGTWRDERGYGDWNVYKADGGWRYGRGFEQREGDESDPIIERVRDIIAIGDPATRRARLYDQFDVPNVINYVAITLLLQHSDQRVHNFYVAHDRLGTDRVALLPWDLDLTWAYGIGGCRDDGMTAPDCLRDPLIDAFWAIDDVRDAVYRRIRSILDGTLRADRIERRHDELIERIGSEVGRLNEAGLDRADPTTRAHLFRAEVERRRQLFERLGAVPRSQGAATPVVISELHYDPADGGPEFIELTNPTSTTVDVSGWEVDGVRLVIPHGTVIPAGGSIILTDDDRAFRAANPGLATIVIEYPGGLRASGEEITLYRVLPDVEPTVVDRVAYGPEAPWPTEPAQGLVSLELASLGADNALPGSWRASSAPGGTPGQGPGGLPPSPGPGPGPGPAPGSGPVEVTLRAQGTTGVERLELRNGSRVLATIELSMSMRIHTVTVDGGVESLRVAFVNNGTTQGRDRNVRIDYVSVGDVTVQTEDPSVHSLGSWANGSCAAGRKRSEILHCNGYFDLAGRFTAPSAPSVPPSAPSEPPSEPSVPPSAPSEPPSVPPSAPSESSGSVIRVLAVGQVGGERIALSVGGVLVEEWVLPASSSFYGSSVTFGEYVYVHPSSVSGVPVRVAFVNDGTGSGDRNVRVDAITVDGVRYESEHPEVFSDGVWRNGGRCRDGMWGSEFLHCNGVFDYPIPAVGPPQPSAPSEPPSAPSEPPSAPSVPPSAPSEPPSVPPSAPSESSGSVIRVLAVGQVGGERIALSVGGVLVEEWVLPASSSFYGSSVTFGEYVYVHPSSVSGVPVRVAFVNDGTGSGDRNVRVDAITVDGVRYESEHPEVFSDGVWRNGGRCRDGMWGSEFLHCNGVFDYPIAPAP